MHGLQLSGPLTAGLCCRLAEGKELLINLLPRLQLSDVQALGQTASACRQAVEQASVELRRLALVSGTCCWATEASCGLTQQLCAGAAAA